VTVRNFLEMWRTSIDCDVRRRAAYAAAKLDTPGCSGFHGHAEYRRAGLRRQRADQGGAETHIRLWLGDRALACPDFVHVHGRVEKSRSYSPTIRTRGKSLIRIGALKSHRAPDRDAAGTRKILI